MEKEGDTPSHTQTCTVDNLDIVRDSVIVFELVCTSTGTLTLKRLEHTLTLNITYHRMVLSRVIHSYCLDTRVYKV